ncbi:hypothetical protein HS7_15710 [Sulfolobales archaeon HS-7]|nr:hypothetical protein HS7_15710 [Sulfolobales archaeon HS-7]
MSLFIDQMDIWLYVLGTSLAMSAIVVYTNALSPKRMSMRKGSLQSSVSSTSVYNISDLNRSLGAYLIFAGIYSMATGIWASITWPLPSSYNLMFSDMWPLFGIASLMLGVALFLGWKLQYVTIPFAFLGIPVAVYGIDMLIHGLTAEPLAAFGLYMAIALALFLSPLAFTNTVVGKGLAALTIALLVIAVVLSFLIGVEASFEHTLAFAKWVPPQLIF